MAKLDELANLFLCAKKPSEMKLILKDLLTDSEIQTFLERWRTVNALMGGDTHRNVKTAVGISISKVTHAANLLKDGGPGFRLIQNRLKNNLK